MSNASTVRRQIAGTQQLTIAPLLAGVVGTTATAFQLNNNGLTLTGGGVIPLSAGVTGLYQGTGAVLHLAATGSCVGLATSNLTLYLYQVPASLLPIADTLAGAQTFTNWNLLATSTERAIGAVTASWSLDARLQLDAAGNLEGQFTDEIISLVDVYAPTTAYVLTGEVDLNFVIVAKATTANITTNTANEFRLDLE